MPHFIVEYSSNIASELDIPALLELINDTAVETGVFPLGGIRSRAMCHQEYRIADGDPDNAFVYLDVRVGRGRKPEVLQQACERIFYAVTEFLGPLYDARALSIGFDVTELDTAYSGKKNNIHDKLARRGDGKPTG